MSSTGTLSLRTTPGILSRVSRGGWGRVDLPLVLGLLAVFGAICYGISVTGVGMSYFLQPAAAAIVLGGTLGVIFITTPMQAVLHSVVRLREVFSAPPNGRLALVEEIVGMARSTRQRGMLGVEPLVARASDPFLRE